MKRKNITLFPIMLFLSVFCIACTARTSDTAGTTGKEVYTGRFDYANYDKVETLFTVADYVIRGKVIDSKVEWLSHLIQPAGEEESDPYKNPGGEVNDEKVLTTIFTVEITDSYKGKAIGNTIEVMQLGGETKTAVYRYEGAPEIAKNIEYVLFLSMSNQRDNASWLLNDVQSLYQVNENELIRLSGNSLELTFEDLSRLAKPS